MSEFHVTVCRVDEAYIHPDEDLKHLSVVKVMGHTLIAGLMEDGSFRYKQGDLVIFIPANAVIPLDLLKYQGFYWDTEKDRGLLKGSKRNRVAPVTRGSVTSDGILFPIEDYSEEDKIGRFHISSKTYLIIEEGSNIEEYLSITEYKP